MDTDALRNWFNLKVRLGGYETTLIAGVFRGGWALHAVGASESSFDWGAFDRALAWLDSSPELYAFQSFPAAATDPGEEVLSVLVLGRLQDSMFFGYQGHEMFWGDPMSLEDVRRIFQGLQDRRLALEEQEAKSRKER